ncbi:MAG: hypothetical protein OXM54_06760 [Acidimicrobiaceae bacterium]|nr:hypothetical protein [Acidimicrobiaceae bacterium]
MEQLATIAGTVAVVQILFKAYGEWSAARRIVAVGGLDARTIAEHRCVPLQFAGSRYVLVRFLVAVTGFFSVRPKSRKQVFAARAVVGMHCGSEIDHRCVRQRDTLRIGLDEGEHPGVFDRSIRRGVASYYRTVAIRDLGDPESGSRAHCVTVRTRGNLRRVSDEGLLLWVEYEVTAASPRSDHRTGPTPLSDIPDDAIEVVVVPQETYRQDHDAPAAQPDGALRGWLARRNPSPIAAAIHWVGKYFVPLAVLNLVSALVVGSVELSAILFTFAMPGALLALLCVRFVLLDNLRRRVRQRLSDRQGSRAATVERSPTRRPSTVPLRHTSLTPPEMWTGATAYGISVGRRANGTDLGTAAERAWRQFVCGLLPPRTERASD